MCDKGYISLLNQLIAKPHEMDAIKLKNNNAEIGLANSCVLADEIYLHLNQGNLFKIHEVLERLDGDPELQYLDQAFVKKFGFSFMKHI